MGMLRRGVVPRPSDLACGLATKSSCTGPGYEGAAHRRAERAAPWRRGVAWLGM